MSAAKLKTAPSGIAHISLCIHHQEEPPRLTLPARAALAWALLRAVLPDGPGAFTQAALIPKLRAGAVRISFVEDVQNTVNHVTYMSMCLQNSRVRLILTVTSQNEPKQ